MFESLLGVLLNVDFVRTKQTNDYGVTLIAGFFLSVNRGYDIVLVLRTKVKKRKNSGTYSKRKFLVAVNTIL